MVLPEEITWRLLPRAQKELKRLRKELGSDSYDLEKEALRRYLCSYFDSGTCRHKQGNQISPMSSTLAGEGGRCLKVRWGVPGKGKSGGLRLAIVAYCDSLLVKICGAWKRSENPSDADFNTAISDA